MEYKIVKPFEENLYEYVGVAYDMSTYVRFDKYGLYGIKNKSDFVAESPDDIENNASFGITWKGFFIKNSYTNGYVSITEDDDFKVVKIVPQVYQLTTDTTVVADKEYYYYDETTNSYIFVADIDPECNPSNEGYYEILSEPKEIKKIKIGALDFNAEGAPTRYGIAIRNDRNFEVFKTDDDGNIIANNIVIRGSIKASVFEYEEVQAIGGILVVRPSSTIKDVTDVEYFFHTLDTAIIEGKKYYEFDNNEYVEVQDPVSIYIDSYYESSTEIILENPDVFQGHDYCKLGVDGRYYTLHIIADGEGKHYILQGLTKNSNDIYYLTSEEIIGSALISMVGIDTSDGGNPKIYNNYGIAINSSDSNVQVPQKAITLFETEADIVSGAYMIEPNSMNFNYRGIFGNLPPFGNDIDDSNRNKVSDIYHNFMVDTQGIYTDNMYIGNNNQYIAFYEDYSGQKHLTIKVSDLILEAGSLNDSLTILSHRIDEIEDNTNKNLHIDPSQIILFTTKQNIDAPEVTHVESGLKLTSNRLQFIIDADFEDVSKPDYQDDYNTWVEKESLNSQTLYFNTAYPRIFNVDYIKTTDQFIVDGKTYYIYDSQGDDYVVVNNPDIEYINNYYEKVISNDTKGNLMIYARSNGHLTIKNIK